MRVSVVATGIDAVETEIEVPVARRRLAEPLAPAVEQPAPVAEAAPEPTSEPVVAEAPTAEEPALFPGFEAELAAETAMGPEMDDLPPPAYRPAEPAPAPAPHMLEQEAQDEAFVAPKPRQPGTPSPEAMARLQAAVSKAPRRQAEAPQPAARPAAADKGRFGIGSLINRMSGQGAEPARGAHQGTRQQPQVQGYAEDEEMDAEQERIEIPAFLRRQAN